MWLAKLAQAVTRLLNDGEGHAGKSRGEGSEALTLPETFLRIGFKSS